MGCGTGLLFAQQKMRIRLKFTPQIPKNNVIYTNFESAVRGFLRERFKAWTENISGGKVNTVDVVLEGPIKTDDEQAQFNRGMNRLLWGFRIVCGDAAGGGAPAPSNFEVSVLELEKEGHGTTGPDWNFEDTCNSSLKATFNKPPAKRKAAARRTAAAKRKTRAKR